MTLDNKNGKPGVVPESPEPAGAGVELLPLPPLPPEDCLQVDALRREENRRLEIARSVLNNDEVIDLYGQSAEQVAKVVKGELVSENPQREFHVGNKVVYPGFGVTEVTEVRELIIGGKKQHFFILKVVNTEQKVMVPVEIAGEVGMRLLIPPEQVEEIFEILGQRPNPSDLAWVRRYKIYKEKMTTGSIFDLAEVFRDLTRNRQRLSVLSYGESMLLKKAREMMVREISMVRGGTEQEIARELDAAVS